MDRIQRILNHEQGHINVTEVLARALIAELRSISLFEEKKPGNETACIQKAQLKLSKFAKDRQQSLMNRLNMLQKSYDVKAGNPNSVKAQADWDGFFESVFNAPVPSTRPVPLLPPKKTE